MGWKHDRKIKEKCIICEYTEKHGNFQLDCGCHMCDECLIGGEALDHEHIGEEI